MKHLFEYVLFLALAKSLTLLPLRLVQKIGSGVGWVGYRLFRYRRRETLENLRNAFPDLPAGRIDRIACRAFRSVGTAFAEFLWFPRLSPNGMREVVICENPEMARAFVRKGRGVVFLTAHFGNWEICAQAAGLYLDAKISLVYKTQSNRFIDRRILDLRSRYGHELLPMHHAVREVLAVLRAGGVVGLAGDQSAARESVWIEFFGRPVPTHQGPAVFALRTGSVLLASVAVRQPDGRYRMRFEHIPTEDLLPDDPSSILELTRRHVQWTESMIRQYPEQWMWMHRRWKHAAPDHRGGETA